MSSGRFERDPRHSFSLLIFSVLRTPGGIGGSGRHDEYVGDKSFSETARAISFTYRSSA